MSTALSAATTAMQAAVTASGLDRATSALWPALLPPSAHGDDEICIASAHGVRVHFTDGSDAVCGTSGLWNVPLGYGDEEIAVAITEANVRASYAGVFRFENVDARRAAADLIDLTGGRFEKVIFTTSGGSANDAVLKIARQYWALEGHPQRKTVLGLAESFHGLTYGAFSVTGEDLGQTMYGADRRLVRHVPVNDREALLAVAQQTGRSLAAIVIEPVLGTGTVPLDDAYLAAIAAVVRQTGALLVVDEVATGFGRTGPMFASEDWPIVPDILVSSKGLTNGTSATAAVLVGARIAHAFADADAVLSHAETQAGSAAGCAAVSATIRRFRELDALARGRAVADMLSDGLQSWMRDDARVVRRRGRGCFQSVSILDDSGAPIDSRTVARLVTATRRAGALVHPGPGGVQFVPPLVSTADDIDALFAAVRQGLRAVRSS